MIAHGEGPLRRYCLGALLLDPARAVAIGDKARQTIERRYDERVLGDRFIGIWERLARKAGAP